MAKKKLYIRNLQDLIDYLGADSAFNMNRRIYKDTGCGASISVRRPGAGWLHNGQDRAAWEGLTEIDAFTIQTIVEGSDATVDSDEFILPVKITDVNKWMEQMEDEASRLWDEANTEEGEEVEP